MANRWLAARIMADQARWQWRNYLAHHQHRCARRFEKTYDQCVGALYGKYGARASM